MVTIATEQVLAQVCEMVFAVVNTALVHTCAGSVNCTNISENDAIFITSHLYGVPLECLNYGTIRCCGC